MSGIKGGPPPASRLPQDMLYTFSGRCILSGGQGELLLHAWYSTNFGCGTSRFLQLTMVMFICDELRSVAVTSPHESAARATTSQLASAVATSPHATTALHHTLLITPVNGSPQRSRSVRRYEIEQSPPRPVTGEAATSAWDPLWAPLTPHLRPAAGLLCAPRTPPSPSSPIRSSRLQSPRLDPLTTPRRRPRLLDQPRQRHLLRTADELSPRTGTARRFRPRTCEDRYWTPPEFSRPTSPVAVGRRNSHLGGTRPNSYLGGLPSLPLALP